MSFQSDIETIKASDKQKVTAESHPHTFRNIIPFGGNGSLPDGAPRWITEVDHPYLHGIYAPVTDEVSSSELEIEFGEVPTDIFGMYVINGPCQRFKPETRYHYYDGDSMLHAIYFDGGKLAYKSKWTKTREFLCEDQEGKNIWPGLAGPFNFDLPYGPIKDNSNTEVLSYAGKLLTLWYKAGQPYAIEPKTLETIGPVTLDGKLTHALSAHSKVDRSTGELILFNYQDTPPYMSYGVANAAGSLIHDVSIDLPGPRSPHDIGITENYSILHDLPYFHDVEFLAKHKKRKIRFHPEVPSRFGIIPRFGNNDDIRWFDAQPCYILHTVNCWEEGDEVIQVACRIPNPGRERNPADGELGAQLAERRRIHELYEWRFNLRTGETSERVLDELNTEFPTINRCYLGYKSRYSYHQLIPEYQGEENPDLLGRAQIFSALIKYDIESNSRQRYDYGEGVTGSESQYIWKQGADNTSAEDDGYVVTFTHTPSDWTSRCLIFDAKNIEKGPITSIKLPRRFPAGFHSFWASGEDVGL